MAKFLKKTAEAEESTSFFTRGEEAATQAREQQRSIYRPEFWLQEDESAEVIVLDKESFNIWVHTLQVRGKPRKFTCRRKNCPLCKINEPRVVSVYRILDLRVFKPKDADKKKAKFDKHGYKQKYWEVGARLQPTIAKLLEKGRLYKQIAEVSRTGKGTATTYQVIPLGEIDDDLRAILVKRNLLKNALKFEEDYAPKSVEDLETALELFGGVEEDDDERYVSRSKREDAPRRRSYLEDADEDDDDDDADEDED